jgi:peptide/nickel transport system permease protein
MSSKKISPVTSLTPVPTPRTARRGLVRRLRDLGAGASVSAAVIVVMAILAVLASAIAPYGPFQTAGSAFTAPGSPGHLLGTDNLGRDTLSQLLHGTQVTLVVGVLAALISVGVGIVVGATAGFFGGVIDNVLMRVTEAFQVLPNFLVALVIVATTGSGVWTVIIIIGVLAWPRTARLVRGQFVAIRNREFVQAARIVGVRRSRVMWSEILPNALPPAIAVASLEVAQAILIQTGLDFIGVGDPNTLSWGVMLRIGGAFLQQAWWLSVFPGLTIFIVCVAFTSLGNGLTDLLDPRNRKR